MKERFREARSIASEESSRHEREATQETSDADIDTVPLEALREESLIERTTEIVPPGGDPYHTSKSAPHSPAQRFPRRTLDDMRRLSEEIKRARGKKPGK